MGGDTGVGFKNVFAVAAAAKKTSDDDGDDGEEGSGGARRVLLGRMYSSSGSGSPQFIFSIFGSFTRALYTL